MLFPCVPRHPRVFTHMLPSCQVSELPFASLSIGTRFRSLFFPLFVRARPYRRSAFFCFTGQMKGGEPFRERDKAIAYLERLGV